MNMNYEALILFLLSKLEKERTVNSGYHILRGKRSAQTIQDIRLFRMQPFYNIYPSLDQENYEQLIKKFHSQKLIETYNNSFKVTSSGLALIEDSSLWIKSLQ